MGPRTAAKTTPPESLIREIVKRILTVSRPDRVILFGSHSTGTAHADSDIDLLILKEPLKDRRRESVRIRRAIGDLGCPFDVVVMQTSWFESSKSVVGGLAFPANKYGRIIYDATRGHQESPG